MARRKKIVENVGTKKLLTELMKNMLPRIKAANGNVQNREGIR